MESLYLLIPIAVIFLILAVRVLYWAVNSGQYDDLDTEGHRILFDEESGTKSSPRNQEAPGQSESPAGQNAAVDSGLDARVKPETVSKPGKH